MHAVLASNCGATAMETEGLLPELKPRAPLGGGAAGTLANGAGEPTQPTPEGGPGSAKKPRLSLEPSNHDSPMAEAAPAAGSHAAGELGAEDEELELLPEEEKTPSQQQPSTPRAPAAPSKSGGSINRAQPSPAVRSLTPIFNGCAAAERARQMGGQYVRAVRRAPSNAALGPSSRAASPTGSAPLKRSRSVLGELLTSAAAQLAPAERRSAGSGGAALALAPVDSTGSVAAFVQAAVEAGTGGRPSAPAPLHTLQVGAVSTSLQAPEAPATAVDSGRVGQHPRRPVGRASSRGPGHLPGADSPATAGPGWLRNATFKPR